MSWEGYEEGESYSRYSVDKRWITNPGTGLWVKKASRRMTVIAFSTESGKANGYEDGRDGDLYLYYGMGPKGDMRADAKLNKAVIEHISKDWDLALFDEPNPGREEIRFVGQFQCRQYRWPVRAKDLNGEFRKALVFEFTPRSEARKFTSFCKEKRARYDNGGWATLPTPRR